MGPFFIFLVVGAAFNREKARTVGATSSPDKTRLSQIAPMRSIGIQPSSLTDPLSGESNPALT